MAKVKILGFVGSLREDSYNKELTRTAAKLLPENAELARARQVFDLADFPLFNQDFERQPPRTVREFKEK